MARIVYRKLQRHSNGFYALMGIHIAVILAGLGSVWYMEHYGHVVTGMNNQVMWGIPHVFAIFLIVAASGALNVASISSVFNKLAYKRFARLSGLLAIALLIGGLAVLVLDLGRPDRLIVAMTKYNFKSIFAWNIYLYMGFFAIVGAYLWTMMARRMDKFTKPVGILAFVWRLVLTTGTGSIFGFLVAREAYDAAIMAPLFIASSFVYGLAFTVWVLTTMCWMMETTLLTRDVMNKLRGLLIIFIATVLYFTAVQHLANIYAAEHTGVERYILLEGGFITFTFWAGQILVGSLVPLALLAHPVSQTRVGLTVACALVLAGGLAQMYVIVIGGQSYPLNLFPGMEVTSTFQDGQFGHYVPSLPEILLAVSGISIAMFATGLVMKVLPFLPEAISDSEGPVKVDEAMNGVSAPQAAE